ncbi:HXXEE domain-containing protein [Pelagibacterium sp. H642]|uniref:HXXEE domain-containing protein n=1 Tax=Pelagibacterium sp. H642 TaxID=1881069 RepID=UPI002815B691|nr:HXXEE domain-containing protein [Pelagibacterium sp. H642]WMT92711.1 HXXEE domain-containing protein [Pelagibacterium sp. H642]
MTNERATRSWAGLTAVLALHNLEEWARDLPAWTAIHTPVPELVHASLYSGFTFGLILVSVVPVIVAVGARRLVPKHEPLLLAVFAWVLVANATWHIALSLLSWTLMPGLFTSLGLLLPVSLRVIWASPSRYRNGWIILWAVIVMIAVTLITLILSVLAVTFG